MKQIYSTLMMLALMVAALSITACGGDDEEGYDDSEEVVFSIHIKRLDGVEEDKIEYTKSWYHEYFEVYGNARFEKKNFIILPMVGRMYQTEIIFPNHNYELSDFQPGFNKFGSNDVEIRHVTDYAPNSTFDGYSISGDAKVIKNDGKSVIIKFNRYKYVFETYYNEYEVTLDGELIFWDYDWYIKNRL